MDSGGGEQRSRPLNILIVGAGIGGLATALGLRKNGHCVTVCEQSASATELGAAVILAPNAHGIIKRLGIDAKKDGAVPRQWHTEYTASGTLLVRQDLSTTAGLWQHSGILCRRYEIHNALKSAAVATEGVGTPVKLRMKSRVAKVAPESATVSFEDGSTMTGDMVIGADGIKSVTRSELHNLRPFPSGKSAYRFLVDRGKALDNPAVGDIIQRDGEFSIWYGTDRRVWLYTTHFNRLLNFVCMHPDSLSETSYTDNAFGEQEDVHHNKSRMLEIFKDFDPRLVALLDMAEPSSVRLWQLLDMDPPPIRQKGRLGLVGDAALPFLPHIGQGAACALEDAASIMALFGPGVLESDIQERLQLYEEIRKSRAEEIHSFSRFLGKDLEVGNEDAKVNRGLMAKKYFPYIFGHDEFDHSAQRLREHQYAKKPALWSMPTSFGPIPQVGQPHPGPGEDGATHISSIMKFKTSKTQLQNLLPREAVTFTSVGSVALASYTHVLHSNVGWLGGQSYNELAFYVHDIQSAKEHTDPSPPGSDYLVVSFVDSADVIISSRENPGIPMVFCNFNIRDVRDQREICALWNGRVFFTLTLSGLEESKNKGALSHSAVLTHRYFPGLELGSQPASDTIISLSRTNQFDASKMTHPSNSRLEIVGRNAQELPTLHHIVNLLAELPILDFVESFIVEGVGSPSFGQVQQL